MSEDEQEYVAPQWFFNWDGEPISADEWFDLYDKSRVLRRTDVQDESGTQYMTLTLWMGTDPNWPGPDAPGEYGPPRIFVTMFYQDGDQIRSTSSVDRDSALQAHRIMDQNADATGDDRG